MVLNTFRRILVAVVLCVGITGVGAGLAHADTDTGFATGEPGEIFTPPYVSG